MPVQEHQQHDLDSYPWHSDDLFDNSKTIVLVGPSGCGKTSYVKSRYPRILMVSHMDQLADYDPTVHQGILFDDMCFKHMPRTAQIHLADQDDDRHIHIRYQTAYIPKHTLKIITSNVRDVFEDDPAINRRLHVIDLGDVQPYEQEGYVRL